MAFLLIFRRPQSCYFYPAISALPPVSLIHTHTHNQLKPLPSPHHSHKPYTPSKPRHPNPLVTMDSYQNTQFPLATAPTEQYSFEEMAAFPTHPPPFQQVVQSPAPVPSGNYFNQGAQHAPLPLTPIAYYTGPVVVQPNAWVPSGSYFAQGGQFIPPQAEPAWSTEQVVPPAAPVAYGNHHHHQGGLYAPPRQTRRARSTTITPGVIKRTPATISRAGVPTATPLWQEPIPELPTPQMQDPQMHLQVAPQPQQQPAAPGPTAHVCHSMGNWADQTALGELCAYTRNKGLRGESCADVKAVGIHAAIAEYRVNERKAMGKFHRLASKNRNQKMNRALRKARSP
jgi:hypothetical protein